MDMLKGRSSKKISAERQRTLRKVIKELQKQKTEIVCWLCNLKASLHKHQKVQKS